MIGDFFWEGISRAKERRGDEDDGDGEGATGAGR